MYLHIRPFDLRSDFFRLDKFSRRAAAGSPGRRSAHRQRGRIVGDLLLDEVDPEAQTPVR